MHRRGNSVVAIPKQSLVLVGSDCQRDLEHGQQDGGFFVGEYLSRYVDGCVRVFLGLLLKVSPILFVNPVFLFVLSVCSLIIR